MIKRTAAWVLFALGSFLSALFLTAIISRAGHESLFEALTNSSHHQDTQGEAFFIYAPGYANLDDATLENMLPMAVNVESKPETITQSLFGGVDFDITFDIPPSSDFRVLLNNLVGCHQESKPGMAEIWFNKENIRIEHIANGYSVVYGTDTQGTNGYFLVCAVHMRNSNFDRTFVKRGISFKYISAVQLSNELGSEEKSKYNLYGPIVDAQLYANIDQADNLNIRMMRVRNGNNTQTDNILNDGESAVIEWDDTIREQFKDIILIVIGGLFGLGFTCFIEGVRPYIDRAVKEQ